MRGLGESRRVQVSLKKPRQVKGNQGKLKQQKCSQGVDGLREIKWIQEATRKVGGPSRMDFTD